MCLSHRRIAQRYGSFKEEAEARRARSTMRATDEKSPVHEATDGRTERGARSVSGPLALGLEGAGCTAPKSPLDRLERSNYLTKAIFLVSPQSPIDARAK